MTDDYLFGLGGGEVEGRGGEGEGGEGEGELSVVGELHAKSEDDPV